MADYKILNAQEMIEHFEKTLSNIRTNRINASVLDSILVEAYGGKMKIVEIATVTVPEPGQLLITPFDKVLITAIEKAIQNSHLNVTPANNGVGVRLAFPPLTEETRLAKTKEVNKALEAGRIGVRNHRTDVLKKEKKRESDGEIGEDDLKRFEDALQKEVDNLNHKLEELAEAKKAELMKI